MNVLICSSQTCPVMQGHSVRSIKSSDHTMVRGDRYLLLGGLDLQLDFHCYLNLGWKWKSLAVLPHSVHSVQNPKYSSLSRSCAQQIPIQVWRRISHSFILTQYPGLWFRSHLSKYCPFCRAIYIWYRTLLLLQLCRRPSLLSKENLIKRLFLFNIYMMKTV